MQKFGISKDEALYFLPPFEWYNQTISDWTAEAGLKLVNFTSGTSSNADYTVPDKNYLGSAAIFEKIKKYETSDPNGLNGFILFSHIGAGPKRADKFYDQLDSFIGWLRSRNYAMVRIDDLLRQ